MDRQRWRPCVDDPVLSPVTDRTGFPFAAECEDRDGGGAHDQTFRAHRRLRYRRVHTRSHRTCESRRRSAGRQGRGCGDGDGQSARGCGQLNAPHAASACGGPARPSAAGRGPRAHPVLKRSWLANFAGPCDGASASSVQCHSRRSDTPSSVASTAPWRTARVATWRPPADLSATSLAATS